MIPKIALLLFLASKLFLIRLLLLLIIVVSQFNVWNIEHVWCIADIGWQKQDTISKKIRKKDALKNEDLLHQFFSLFFIFIFLFSFFIVPTFYHQLLLLPLPNSTFLSDSFASFLVRVIRTYGLPWRPSLVTKRFLSEIARRQSLTECCSEW